MGFMSLYCDPGKIKCRKFSKALLLNMQAPDLKKKKAKGLGSGREHKPFT